MAFIEDMVKRRILGHDKSSVIRGLLTYAIQDIVRTEYVQKYLASRKALKSG